MRKPISFLATLCALVIVSAFATAQDVAEEIRHYRAPLMTEKPAIDGQIGGKEWSLACGFDGLAWNGKLEERKVRVHVGATRAQLFVAVVSELPPNSQLIG